MYEIIICVFTYFFFIFSFAILPIIWTLDAYLMQMFNGASL